MQRRVAVRGIIVHDTKLLCVRHKAYCGKSAPDYWCTPGGGIDIDEPIIPALEREIFEEIGVNPVLGSLLYVQQYKKDGEQMEFFFHITNSRDFLNIDLSKTTHGQDEIEEILFIDPAKYNVLPKFL